MAHLYRIEILENQLRRLIAAVPAIRQTVIVSIEGFVVASYPTGDQFAINSPQIAAMAAALIALGDQALDRLENGIMERLMIEGRDGAIIVYPINRQAALAALVKTDTKMGLTLHAVSRTVRVLGEILPA